MLTHYQIANRSLQIYHSPVHISVLEPRRHSASSFLPDMQVFYASPVSRVVWQDFLFQTVPVVVFLQPLAFEVLLLLFVAH